jgi:hypothetical protein
MRRERPSRSCAVAGTPWTPRSPQHSFCRSPTRAPGASVEVASCCTARRKGPTSRSTSGKPPPQRCGRRCSSTRRGNSFRSAARPGDWRSGFRGWSRDWPRPTGDGEPSRGVSWSRRPRRRRTTGWSCRAGTLRLSRAGSGSCCPLRGRAPSSVPTGGSSAPGISSSSRSSRRPCAASRPKAPRDSTAGRSPRPSFAPCDRPAE